MFYDIYLHAFIFLFLVLPFLSPLPQNAFYLLKFSLLLFILLFILFFLLTFSFLVFLVLFVPYHSFILILILTALIFSSLFS